MLLTRAWTFQLNQHDHLFFINPQKAKTAVHHRRKQSSTNAGAVVAGDSPVQVSSAPREDTIDSYGFEISITTDQRDDLERCAAQQAKQLVKWQDSSVFQKILPPEDRLKKLCRKGIPPQYRKWVWLKVSGAEKRRLANGSAYYKAAVEAGRENTACAHQIKLDVPRTFPSCPWVQSEPGQVSLSRVLFAFAHHNPTVGYCQGMNYVVALLLVALGHDEEAAFWVLVSLIDDDRGILYQDMYAKDLSGCHVEMRSLKELVALKLPRLATHLEELHCDMSIVATDWFLCLFCTSLPAETAIRVWDALLHEGTKVLFRVGLALLKMNEPLLLVADNPGDLLRVARNAAADEFDRDELMRVAFDGLGSLPMEKIKGFRDTNQRKVDKEMAAREMRANLRAAVKEGYVLTEAEAALLNSETEDDSEEGSEDSASRGGSSWKRFGTVLGERTKATLDAGKQKMKQLR
jgi:hypothetical protein